MGGLFVPNTLWGLSITEACNVHDFMYFEGGNEKEKAEADRAFLNNMVRIIDAQSGPLLKWLRRYRAITYYSTVRDFGGPRFWTNSNKPGTMNHAREA